MPLFKKKNPEINVVIDEPNPFTENLRPRPAPSTSQYRVVVEFKNYGWEYSIFEIKTGKIINNDTALNESRALQAAKMWIEQKKRREELLKQEPKEYFL